MDPPFEDAAVAYNDFRSCCYLPTTDPEPSEGDVLED
jgi:hypothetical protein